MKQPSDGAVRPAAIPMRTCVGCWSTLPQTELLRFRLTSGSLVVDGHGPRGSGRGAYLCAKIGCWEAAVRRRGFHRSLRLSFAALDQDSIPESLKVMIPHSPRG